MTTPRGIRNNNPGNIEWGSPWQGLVPADRRTDSRFCQFTDAAFGIRALATTLITYQDKRRAADGSPIDTVYEAIERWAPPVENNTKAYADAVAEDVTKAACLAKAETAAAAISGSVCRKIGPHDIVDFHHHDVMFGLVSGIINHENGNGPKDTLNTWYSDDVINEGLRRAGIVMKKKTVAGVPVTKETAAAGTAAVVGVGQIVDVIPQVSAAIDKSQDNLTSGDWVRITLGVVTIGIAVFVAYSQYKKRQAGAV